MGEEGADPIATAVTSAAPSCTDAALLPMAPEEEDIDSPATEGKGLEAPVLLPAHPLADGPAIGMFPLDPRRAHCSPAPAPAPTTPTNM